MGKLCITAPPLCTAYPWAVHPAYPWQTGGLCTVCTALPAKRPLCQKPCPYLGGKPGSSRHWCRAPPDPDPGERTGAEKAAPPRAGASDNRRIFFLYGGPAAFPAGPGYLEAECPSGYSPALAGPAASLPGAHACRRMPGLPAVPACIRSGQAVYTSPLRNTGQKKTKNIRLEEHIT